MYVRLHCVVFKVLDECGKSFRTLTDNDYTLASTAVSTLTLYRILSNRYNSLSGFFLRIKQEVLGEML